VQVNSEQKRKTSHKKIAKVAKPFHLWILFKWIQLFCLCVLCDLLVKGFISLSPLYLHIPLFVCFLCVFALNSDFAI
jgi:hypothetical protein